MEVHAAAPGLGGAQPADGRQIPLCAVAMVRRPDDVLGHSAHPEVEQRGVARSHAPARRDWRARPVLERLQPSCLAKSLGAGQIATTKSLAKCERPRWRNISESGQDKLDLALPFPVFDDNNTEIMLTTTSPALLKSMLKAAVRRTNQRQAAAKLADSSHFTGTRASLEIARRVADSKGGRLSRKESSSVNAIWTKCRLKGAGYELESTLCDMCGQERDTLWHRIWFCRNPQVLAARNRFVNPALQAEATRVNADLLWVTRAIIDDPSDHLPPPNATNLAVNEEILDVDAWNLGTDQLCAYSDGSCTQELSREMKRASWGLILYNSSTKPLHATSGPSQLTCGSPARQVNLQGWRWLWRWRRVTPI